MMLYYACGYSFCGCLCLLGRAKGPGPHPCPALGGAQSRGRRQGRRRVHLVRQGARPHLSYPPYNNSSGSSYANAAMLTSDGRFLLRSRISLIFVPFDILMLLFDNKVQVRKPKAQSYHQSTFFVNNTYVAPQIRRPAISFFSVMSGMSDSSLFHSSMPAPPTCCTALQQQFLVNWPAQSG